MIIKDSVGLWRGNIRYHPKVMCHGPFGGGLMMVLLH